MQPCLFAIVALLQFDAREALASEVCDVAKTESCARNLRDLKWRWAEHKIPSVNMSIPKLWFDKWNMPAGRAALVKELEKKMQDPEAVAKKYRTRGVEFADVDYPERRMTFADYTKAFEWLALEVNIQSRDEDDQANETGDPAWFIRPIPAPAIWDAFWRPGENFRLFFDSKQESSGEVHKFSDSAPPLEDILRAFRKPRDLPKNVGISGASMYLSDHAEGDDSEYIVKKLTPHQTRYAHRLKKSFLKDHAAHLLVPIYYLFERCKITNDLTSRWKGCDSWVVHPTVTMPSSDQYDLKGGTTFMGVKFIAEDNVFKKEYPQGLELSQEHLRQLDAMMAETEAVLTNTQVQVFDYSLLLKISKHPVSQINRDIQNGSCPGVVGQARFVVTVPGSPDERCVSLGIIDYLGNNGQKYARGLGFAAWESSGYAKVFRDNVVQRKPYTCPCASNPCPYFHKKSCTANPQTIWRWLTDRWRAWLKKLTKSMA